MKKGITTVQSEDPDKALNYIFGAFFIDSLKFQHILIHLRDYVSNGIIL